MKIKASIGLLLDDSKHNPVKGLENSHKQVTLRFYAPDTEQSFVFSLYHYLLKKKHYSYNLVYLRWKSIHNLKII